LLGIVGFDGLVAFRHPINVAIANATRSPDQGGAKGSLSAAIVDNSFIRPTHPGISRLSIVNRSPFRGLPDQD